MVVVRWWQFGAAMGAEQKIKGTNVMLGPGINLARTPMCGRNFEYQGTCGVCPECQLWLQLPVAVACVCACRCAFRGCRCLPTCHGAYCGCLCLCTCGYLCVDATCLCAVC